MAVHAVRYVCGWLRGGGIGRDSSGHFAIRYSGHRLNWIVSSWFPDSDDTVTASFFIGELRFPR